MDINENYGVISGFIANQNWDKYSECNCPDHCDCHCTDPDDE